MARNCALDTIPESELAQYTPILNLEKLKNASTGLKACAEFYPRHLATARWELAQLQARYDRSVDNMERGQLTTKMDQLRKLILPMHQALMPLL